MVLATVMALPLVGLFFFRLYENQLLHQTEAELIAQSAVLSAVFADEIERALPPDALLGAAAPAAAGRQPAEPYEPITPMLDLASDELLGRRPEAREPASPPSPAYLAIGARLAGHLARTQRVTLAGFRLLDPQGTVIAGREEVGLSLAHVDEVAAALKGRFGRALRRRVSSEPPPPLYSMSRGTGLRVFTAMPVVVRDQVAGVVYASRTPSNVFKHFYEERRKLALAALTVLALTLAIGFTFSRFVTRPVHELIRRTTDIARGDRGAMRPLSRHGTREFAMLAQSFLDMAQSLNDRSDYIRTFAAHVSHELKSPLAAIQGAAELLREATDGASHAMTDEERKRFLDNIIADTQRLAAIVNRLRELAKADNPQTDGSTTVGAVVADLRAALPALAVCAEGDLDQPIPLSAENARIVLSHLADNAVRHNATTLTITAAAQAGVMQLMIRDDGQGVSENNRDRIFEPFFTTRRDAGGTGMGLAIVQAMLQAHGGSISLAPSSKGAVFEMLIPLSRWRRQDHRLGRQPPA
jgi:signal transduction histidine kinase